MENLQVLPKINIREYSLEHNSINVWSDEKYYEWMMDLSPKDRTLLLRDNRKILKDIFGKPSGYFRGEFYHHCWVFDNGFCILSAKDKGTGIEFFGDLNSEQCIEFGKMLIHKIKNHDLHTKI